VALYLVGWQILNDVSEELTVSIIKVVVIFILITVRTPGKPLW
jgi:hypothetical protein